MIQSVIQSVKVERTPVPLVEDYSSQLRVAMDNGLVLQGIPVGGCQCPLRRECLVVVYF